VGAEQLEWLSQDLGAVSRDTPIVLFSHSPIQKIYKGWNFWTDDAEQVQEILQPFAKVTVVYGHVHQIQYNQIGNITFHSVMATAWPWPYPETYAQAQPNFPSITVPMNRGNPFFERDATGWQSVEAGDGRLTVRYKIHENADRVVGYNPATGQPEDRDYQDPARRIPAQTHY
jgi:Icc protein